MKARCISLFIAVAMAFPALALANGDLERAIEDYERSHYAESVRLLKVAAEANDARAQEMLGFMLLYGPALYGPAVPRDPVTARHWLRKAASQGSETAQYVLQKLTRTAESPRGETAIR